MENKFWIEVAAIAIMVGGPIGIFIDRWRTKRGIGVRIIQFLAVVLVVPSVLILALEGVLSSETVARYWVPWLVISFPVLERMSRIDPVGEAGNLTRGSR